MKTALSLTPGFNPVCADARRQNRFNGFPPAPDKPLKRFFICTDAVTGLKPGVNESEFPIPATSAAEQAALSGLVDGILAAKRTGDAATVTALESEIDTHVFRLYALTPAEIALVKAAQK